MNTATLITGEQVSSSSEAWRHECEARHVAQLATRAERQHYIAEVTRKRGAAAGQALQTLATTIYNTERKGAHA